MKGVANLRCSLIFEICLFFNEIDAKVLDGTRLSRVPRVRGVNLHVLKTGGLVVQCAEHLFIVDEELDLGISQSLQPTQNLCIYSEFLSFFVLYSRLGRLSESFGKMGQIDQI